MPQRFLTDRAQRDVSPQHVLQAWAVPALLIPVEKGKLVLVDLLNTHMVF